MNEGSDDKRPPRCQPTALGAPMAQPHGNDFKRPEPYPPAGPGTAPLLLPVELLDGLTGGVLIFDPTHRIAFMNRAIEALTGLTRRELMGQDGRMPARQPIEQTLESPEAFVKAVSNACESDGSIEGFECHVLPGEGRQERWLQVQSRCIRSGPFARWRVEEYTDITPLKVRMKEELRRAHAARVPGAGQGAASPLDITEQREDVEELIKAQKLESLGVLAGGIAHDFNNMLGVILGNVSLAKMYTVSGEELHEILTEAERASLRAKDLTYQLLTFSKGGAPVKKIVSISDVVKDSCEFALRGAGVSCRFHIPRDVWPVEIDVGQVRQVINNMVTNAWEAMPEGGKIHIAVENRELGEKDGVPLPPGKYVTISIRDHGIGIPEEHFGKIFDPYFTTKRSGSGLGLAMAYSIIKKHDGSIGVESEPGKGTTFRIHLPASHNDPSSAGDKVTPTRSTPNRVLLMDDDEMLRSMAKKMITRLGYRVDTASDGAEAIHLYARAMESGVPYDVVILDLTIPGGMGGKEAVGKLLEIDPSVKAIVSSGYSNDPVMSNYAQYGFAAVVSKPYQIQEMGRVLIDVISAKSV